MIRLLKRSWAIIPFFIILVAYSSQNLDPTQPLKFFLLAVFLLIANGVFIWHIKQFNNQYLTGTFFKVFALYIIYIGCSLIYTNSLSNGIYEFLKATSFLNSLIVLTYYFKSKKLSKLVYLSYFFSVFQLLVIVGLLTSLTAPGFKNIWLNSKPYAGLFLNPNLTCQLLFLSSIIPVFTIIYALQGKRLRVFQAFLVLLSLVFTLIIGSKTIYICWVVFAFCLVYYKVINNEKIGKKTMLLMSFIVLATIASLLYMFYPKFSAVSSFQHRKELWVRTVGMINESPITGVGLGSWHINNLNHVPGRSIESEENYKTIYSPLGNIFYERPHNDFLWVWSETGLVGLILYLLLFGLIFYHGYHLIRQSKGKKVTLYILVLSGITAYLVIAFLSFPKERVEQSLLLMLFFSILLSDTPTAEKKLFFKPGIIVFSVLTLLSGFSIYWSYSRLRSDFYLRNVVEAKRNERWQRVLRETKKAENITYRIATNGTPLKWFKGTAQVQLGLIKEAHTSFQEAYKDHPTHVYVLNNLATTYAMLGNQDSAIALYRRTSEINPLYEDPIINLSGIYFNKEDYGKAWEFIKKIPLNSKHPKYKLFLNVILKQKFEDIFIEKAKVKELINPEAFLKSDENVYFTIYVKSQKSDLSVVEVFFSDLEKFNRLNERLE